MVINKIFVRFVSGVLAMSLTLSAAQAACWQADAVAAAKVRDLDTMLMVAALRCRNSGSDFLTQYNGFVRSSRTALSVANDRLRGHFAIGLDAKAALIAYDRYVTSLANRYGAGSEGLNCRDMASINDAAAREGASFLELEALATRAEVEPILIGGRCPVVIARSH
jgi:hypothetical protein